MEVRPAAFVVRTGPEERTPMGTNRIVATGAAVAALVLAGTGCSDSQSDAVKAVCDAQDEVSSAVANLKL